MNEQLKRKLSREEYEVQFFGFSHTNLKNCVKHTIKEEIKNTVATFIMNQKKASNDIPEENFNDVADRLNDLFINASNTPIQKIEDIIEDCIAVPDHVLLPEDEEFQRNQHVGVDMSELDREIEELKARAAKAKYMEYMLKKELIDSKHIVELGTRKVNELQKRSLTIKQKDRRNKELAQKLEVSNALN